MQDGLPPFGTTKRFAVAGGRTSSLWDELALLDPHSLVAVTRTRTVAPTRSLPIGNVSVVAPGISTQAAPLRSQRLQLNAKLVGEFVQVPVVAVNELPTSALPEIAGGAEFAGGGGGGGSPAGTEHSAVDIQRPTRRERRPWRFRVATESR